ncbi:MAG TPA: NrfD/PsrC family molybdoenzyme membrane anchor subunit [Candidatus Sulfotelmatobacter sp.]|jgi:Ni/Fe-hydrogenase subunit HybB-like protein|nr:NrfD/PsrC family molybdoenzyme membrane anchor subunit [Candidatus Sulfotelmatobacter sp.]
MSESSPAFADRLFLGATAREYARGLLTPGNLAIAGILAVGLPVLAYRFAFGLGAATHLSQQSPWGLWIGFDMLCGMALAAGGYTLAAAVYMFGLKEYRPVVRAAILTGFLGYVFAVIGLLCDLGQPWRIPYPLVYSWGTTSVMFEVGWCVALYTSVLALEFLPAFFEWLGWTTPLRLLGKIELGAIVLGIVLSTLHQSSLGSLFLMAPGKLHPLWYSPYLPVFFFVSSIAAGLAMVIVESRISHRLFHDRTEPARRVDVDRIALGLGRAAAVVLFAYVFLRLQGVAEAGAWRELATPWGAWWLVEVGGFALVPSFIFAYGSRHALIGAVRTAALLAIVGVVLNRINVSIIALHWKNPLVYVPSWMEIVGSVTIVTLGVVTFRWIVNRMPILSGRGSALPSTR